MNYQSTKATFEIFLREQALKYFNEDNILNSAVKYSLLAEGKRIRPMLVHSISQIYGGNLTIANICGTAVEMIHSYSLIHDDLPAMDNDDFRRGKPTNHKVYGEATAILAGDALLNFSPEFLIKELSAEDFSSDKILLLSNLLLKASGHEGMIKGQILDLGFEKRDHQSLSNSYLLDQLQLIHKLKTGSVIEWSCLAGLISSNNDEVIKTEFIKVQSIGEKIGLLFQIVDDYLDATASFKDLGKTPGKDHKQGKLTYVTLLGLEETKDKAFAVLSNIKKEIGNLGTSEILDEIVNGLEQKLI